MCGNGKFLQHLFEPFIPFGADVLNIVTFSFVISCLVFTRFCKQRYILPEHEFAHPDRSHNLALFSILSGSTQHLCQTWWCIPPAHSPDQQPASAANRCGNSSHGMAESRYNAESYADISWLWISISAVWRFNAWHIFFSRCFFKCFHLFCGFKFWLSLIFPQSLEYCMNPLLIVCRGWLKLIKVMLLVRKLLRDSPIIIMGSTCHSLTS